MNIAILHAVLIMNYLKTFSRHIIHIYMNDKQQFEETFLLNNGWNEMAPVMFDYGFLL